MVNKHVCGAVLAACISLSACVPKSDLDAANAAASSASAEVQDARAQIAKLNDQVLQLEKQNGDLRAAVSKAADNLDDAQKQLARKPAMPVSVVLRKAFFGNSLVAVFSTTIKQDFPVLVTVHSTALNTTKQFRVQLNALRPSELGTSDGAAIDYDDEMLIENANFEPAKVTFQRR